jgi:hypothetical protein
MGDFHDDLPSDPAVATLPDARLVILFVGPDGRLYRRSQRRPGAGN